MRVEVDIHVVCSTQMACAASLKNCLHHANSSQDHLNNISRKHPEGHLVLEALVPRLCGEDFSLERLETLGDAFLKYAATLFLFSSFPQAHEGAHLLHDFGAEVQMPWLWLIALGCLSP